MNRKILLFALIGLFLYAGWAFLTESKVVSKTDDDQEVKTEYIIVPTPTDTSSIDTAKN